MQRGKIVMLLFATFSLIHDTSIEIFWQLWSDVHVTKQLPWNQWHSSQIPRATKATVENRCFVHL